MAFYRLYLKESRGDSFTDEKGLYHVLVETKSENKSGTKVKYVYEARPTSEQKDENQKKADQLNRYSEQIDQFIDSIDTRKIAKSIVSKRIGFKTQGKSATTEAIYLVNDKDEILRIAEHDAIARRSQKATYQITIDPKGNVEIFPLSKFSWKEFDLSQDINKQIANRFFEQYLYNEKNGNIDQSTKDWWNRLGIKI